MADIEPSISITKLNVNSLNNPIKRQQSLDWIERKTK